LDMGEGLKGQLFPNWLQVRFSSALLPLLHLQGIPRFSASLLHNSISCSWKKEEWVRKWEQECEHLAEWEQLSAILLRDRMGLRVGKNESRKEGRRARMCSQSESKSKYD
jgi:hypothetical protein